MTDGITFDMSEPLRLGIELSSRTPIRVVVRVGQALRKSTYDLEGDAKILAPVDTGFLQNSISSTIVGLSSEIGPTALYGPFVEDGTSTQAPQPYVGPAFDRNAPLFVAAVGIAGEEAIF